MGRNTLTHLGKALVFGVVFTVIGMAFDVVFGDDAQRAPWEFFLQGALVYFFLIGLRKLEEIYMKRN